MSDTTSAARRRAAIAQTLDPTGVAWSWLPGDEPVATLVVRIPDRPALALTVRHTGDVLQVIAHGALAGPATPQLLADRDALNQDWAFGRGYLARRTGTWDLSIGLHAPGRPAAPGAWAAALLSLADAPGLLDQGVAPTLRVEPPRTPGEVMPAVARALADAGLNPTMTHDGEVATVVLQMDRARASVQWCFASPALLVARARPVGGSAARETADVLERLNALNGRLDIGGVGFWYGQGLAFGWIAHPVPWIDVTAELVRWTSERAASWAEAAHEVATSR